MVDINDVLKAINSGYSSLGNLNDTINPVQTPDFTYADLTVRPADVQTPLPEEEKRDTSLDSFKKHLADKGYNLDYGKDSPFYGHTDSSTYSGNAGKKTIGEYIYNNTSGGIKNLFTGLSMAAQDPYGTILKPSWDFLSNPEISGFQKLTSIPDKLIVEPLTGQSIWEMGEKVISGNPGQIVKDLGEHHYHGGTLDTALTILPWTKTGQAAERAIGNTAKTVGKQLPVVKQIIQHLDDRAAVQNAKKYVQGKNVLSEIEMHKGNVQFKNDVNKLFKNYNIKEADFADLIKKMRGEEGMSLADMTGTQKVIYKDLDKILTDYDTLIKKYTEGEAGNVQEIIQHGVSENARKGINSAYQNIKDDYNLNGFFDLGEYVDNTTGEITKGAKIPSTPIDDLLTPEPVVALEQILRRNNIRKEYNVQNQLKRIDSKYKNSDPNVSGLDKELDIAEANYKDIVNRIVNGEKALLENPDEILNELDYTLRNIPEEYQEVFSERFAKDFEDVYKAKFSEKPITDYGTPENPNRYKQFNKELQKARKYETIGNDSLLNQLSKKTQRFVKQYLTPDEWTSHLEAGSTLGDLTKYMSEVSKEALAKMKKPDTVIDALTGEAKPIDLRNTTWRLTEDGRDVLAEMAIDTTNPKRATLAQQFLQSADLAEKGLLRRITQADAPVDKTNLIVRRALQNENTPLATERVYGNAKAEDIASAWANPERWLHQSVKALMKDKTIQDWIDSFTSTGEPITLKNSRPEDIRFIKRDILEKRANLKDSLKNAPAKLPEGVNPQDYIPVDKYILQATEELYYPKSAGLKMPAWVRDLTSIYNQSLLASGNYLFGNILGGLHGMITDSGFHIVQDIHDAIRTKGQLIKDLGLERGLPHSTDTRLYTKPNTPSYKALRLAELAANKSGGALFQKADAFIQNSIAETRAHSLARQRGIKFEDRNLEWIKTNQTKESLVQYMEDIKNMSYIYADETLADKLFGPEIGKAIMSGAGVANPFFRWVDQATQSSYNLMKNHPIAMGYAQGAVLGNAVWSQEYANAQNIGISNPQNGKIYKFDPKTGNTKVTTTEMIPILTTAKLLSKEGAVDYLTNIGQGAAIGAIVNDLFSTKDKYGRIKQRSDWKNIQPEFTKQVRYKDGVVQTTPDLDEQVASLLRRNNFAVFMNKTALPIYGELTGQKFYQPYNDQVFASPQGNPKQDLDSQRLIDRALTNYTRPLREGEDTSISPEQQMKLQQKAEQRRTKEEIIADEKRRGVI